jgi:hypothetical protein
MYPKAHPNPRRGWQGACRRIHLAICAPKVKAFDNRNFLLSWGPSFIPFFDFWALMEMACANARRQCRREKVRMSLPAAIATYWSRPTM